MSHDDSKLVGIDDIRAARERIQDLIQRTPIEESRSVSAITGVETLLKCEHLQRTGSFKIRGAANRIAVLGEAERAAGVVCASAGNHAQGVALAASTIGVTSTVFMPADAPLPKVEATRGYGANVVLGGATFDDALEAARAFEHEHGATFVHPFDHPDVIAGQGTLGLEILEQAPEAATVLVAIGGGGLIAGVAVALKALRPDIRIIGVEPAGAASAVQALGAGHAVTLPEIGTFADGIAVKRVGDVPFAHIHRLVDDVVVVTDEDIARAVLLLVERAKQVVEPAGAAPLAALLRGDLDITGPAVPLLCGGNVDPLLLGKIIQSGLYEEGRYLVVNTRVGDRPGALAQLLGLIAGAKANVLAIQHHRLNTALGLLEVGVEIQLETRGVAHIREVVRVLEEAGYPVEAEIPD
ncbi:threonine ammonia-lyase [Euzebya tangerina]|uniref:threonine ammonia-lyase n=1 Tax=Euzebya tangerina TaxID=591198 RepID=UPI00196A6F04|nr:threonine ammonia-lyase [Euzebya tangerina]